MTCAGSASTGTSRSSFNRERTAAYDEALDDSRRAASPIPASARGPTSPQSLTRRTATRRPPIPAPAARCPTIPSGAPRRRTAGGSIRPRRWHHRLALVDRSRRRGFTRGCDDSATRSWRGRMRRPPITCLRRRRCGERRDARSCAAPTCAPRRRSSACSRSCSAFPSRPISTIPSSPMPTAAASPSAISLLRLRQCARAASTGERSPPTCSTASFRLVSRSSD